LEKLFAYINTIAGKTGEEIKGMMKDVRELAVEIGLDVAKAAAALYDIYSNLGETGQNMMVLRESARAAVAGFVDISVTGAAVTGVMNAMGLSVEETTDILDKQFKTIERGKVNYAEIAANSGQFLASAKAAGQEYGRVMGGYATLTKGIQNVSQSATAMNAFFTRFRDAEFVRQMQDVAGVTVVVDGKFRDYTEVVGELNDKMKTMSQYAQAEMLKKLMPGEEAQRALLTMINSFETFKEDVREVAENSLGTLDANFKKMSETSAQKIAILQAQLEDLKITLGEDLVDAGGDFFKVIELGARAAVGAVQALGGVIQIVMGRVAMFTGLYYKLTGDAKAASAAFAESQRLLAKGEERGQAGLGNVAGAFYEFSKSDEQKEAERQERIAWRKVEEHQAALKKKRAGLTGKPGDGTGEGGTGTGATAAAMGATKAETENILKKASELKRRYLELDVRNRIKFLEEERDAVKRLGGDTLGYEMAIAQEKSDIVERQKEKARKFYEGLKGMAERYAAARQEIEEETARGTMGRFEFERHEAKAAYEEELRRAKELSGAEREAAEKLARLRYKAAGSKADTAEADALRAVMEINADEYEKRRGAVQREAEEKIEMWKDNAAARAEVEKWL
ncbi:MAG TPA: phage tail tape measure protein, partial [bacterium]|nr:phage tail tape measure protein [bacterium]